MITGDEALYWAKKLLGEQGEDLVAKINNVIQMVTDLTAVVSGKVDKEAGKGLSSNDFTNTLKTKLDGIADGAEVNVNADWNANSGDAKILNKPANLVQDASYVHTDNNYTSTEKTKLSGIESGAQVNTVSPSDLAAKVNTSDFNLFDVVTPSFSSLPKTFYSSKLTSSCKLVGNAIHLSTPTVGDIDWSVAFANGSLTISGTFHGSTATTASMSIWLPTETITLTNS